MPIWTLSGLGKGKATTGWPDAPDPHGQTDVLGMPRFHPERCIDGCADCIASCPTNAIRVREADGQSSIEVDYGRCVVCQVCVEACPTGAMEPSHDWAFGARKREDLILGPAQGPAAATSPEPGPRRRFRRSLHVRHVDSGSCNGCESELQALGNPYYNLHRFGIFFTASPRFADLLLVTGAVTYAMQEPLRRSWEAMPEPRWVMAAGTCAVSGGVAGGGYSCGNGLEDVLPVDLYLPGCPPNPAAIISSLLMFLDRKPQQVTRGRCVE